MGNLACSYFLVILYWRETGLDTLAWLELLTGLEKLKLKLVKCSKLKQVNRVESLV